MIKNHNLTPSIDDSTKSNFVTKIEYKSEWSGKNIHMIAKFELSSEIFNVCRYHNYKLILKDRKWKFLIVKRK